MTVDRRHLARAGLFERYRAESTTTWVEASGTSMAPLIRQGDRLLVEFGAPRVERGDVVLFLREDGHVAHRVVRSPSSARGGRLRTKGDATARFDPPIDPAAIVGVARAVSPGAGGRVRRTGLGGRAGLVVALVSASSGRAARKGRRLAVHLPRPIRDPVSGGLDHLARIPTRLVTALLASGPWAIRAEWR